MRRGVSGKPDPIEYKEKKKKLSELKQLEDEGKLIYTIWMNRILWHPFVFLMDGKILANIYQLIAVKLSV
jgi:lysophospholipid acyltransferase (LPLAT)-like uncharacterized protein